MSETLRYQIDEYYLDLQRRAQDMEIMDAEDTRSNPFPGLRPFRTAEAHLFFGREGQSEELIQRLMQTRFLGVLGNSGSGKSSLVRAGLIPALHAGKKQQRISDWKIVICRPGNSPVQNMAAALAGAGRNTTDPAVIAPEVERLLPLLRDSSFGLLEAEAGAGEHDKTLLIVDQFEELFRFGREIPPGEAAHFVDLLLSAVQQEGAHLYVVVTMRSEFLGECVRYRGLPEIINQGQYLVPRLSGENVRRAVAGPLGVVQAPVDATLVNRLVREVGDNMDQLPLLQHALMRSYRHWQGHGTDAPITHADYEATGRMALALGLHADEHYAALDDKGKAIARLIFQRLTDLSAGEKGGRRPTRMDEIYGLAEAVAATRPEVDAVIEQFRRIDTSFLMPPPGAPLQEENMLDISHESLIRNWERLSDWAKAEADNARLYQRLQQACAENAEDPTQGWISGALLQRLSEWRADAPLNAYWAARYHPADITPHDWPEHQALFEQNMAFLQQCIDREQEESTRKESELVEKARQKQRAKYRSIIIMLTSAATLIAVALAVWAFKQRQEAKTNLDALMKSEAVLASLILPEVDSLVYRLEYDSAYQKMQALASFNVAKKEVSDALMEFAFWYAETGDTLRAWGILDTAYHLAGRSLPQVQDKTRAAAREALRALNPARDSFLQARYFPVMLDIPGGIFDMGDDDEKPVRKVTLTAFKMAQTETTWWQYALYCRVKGITLPAAPSWGRLGDNPVVNVSWEDAVEYANWLSEREGLQKAIAGGDGKPYTIDLRAGYRLPTEAEWEYAARADGNTPYAGSKVIDEVAWYSDNSGGRTRSVGGKAPNALGLYDMSGNVWEWTWDWYGKYPPEAQINPVGPGVGSYRVLRGGSWIINADDCRVSCRFINDPDDRYDGIGFRVALVP